MPANSITVTVATTAGDFEAEFNLNQPLKVVFNRALTEVGGGVDRGAFALEYEDAQLDLSRQISDYVAEFGWVDGTVLELVPAPVVI